jgi:Nucleotidyl transferase
VRTIAKFVEKPDQATAGQHIKSGYLWNSGNFMFRASVLLDEYRNVDAKSVEAVVDSVTKAGRDLGFVTLSSDAFGAANAISIDYAVMENTVQAAVVPVSCGRHERATVSLSPTRKRWKAAQQLRNGKPPKYQVGHEKTISRDNGKAFDKPTRFHRGNGGIRSACRSLHSLCRPSRRDLGA